MKNAKKIYRYHAILINKVTTGVYVTPPPFHGKHQNYGNFKKEKHYFCFHIHVTTHQKNGLTTPPQKGYLAKFVKLLQVFKSPPPTPFCNILTNKSKYRLKFIFVLTHMLLHIRKMDLHTEKRYLDHFCHHPHPTIGKITMITYDVLVHNPHKVYIMNKGTPIQKERKKVFINP